MALSTPPSWERFTQVNVSLDAVSGSPAISPRPSGAFGASFMPIAAEEDSNAIFVRREAPIDRGRVGTAAETARRVFAALNVAPEEATAKECVRPVSTSGSRADGRTVVLQQHVRGHDIVGANLKVHFSPSGAVVVTGRPLGDVRAREPRDQATVSAGDAGAAAAALFDLDPASVHETKLVVFPLAEGGARWAWRITLLVDDPVADVRAYVDAANRSVLLSFNVVSALRGRASIYAIDPLRTPTCRNVSLAELGPMPDDVLAGRRLVVSTGKPPALSRRDRDFRLTDADAGFDEANAYFHLRSALRYFSKLGTARAFPTPPFRPIKATVRDFRAPNDAFYVPDSGELRFGDVGPRPTARSADVLYHELGHAVSDSAARLGRGLLNSEARGLSEGYSDYFANSALDDPRFASWVAPHAERDASNPALHFPPGFVGEEHSTGAVWASVLWSIRTQVGREETDRIAFQSLRLLNANSTFADGLRGLIAADSELSASGQRSGVRSAIQTEWDRRAN